jgi:hypothetical protein
MEADMAKKSSAVALTDENEWRVESDLRTLIEAEQIEKDPKRMKMVRALAKKRMLEVASVAAEGGSEDC